MLLLFIHYLRHYFTTKTHYTCFFSFSDRLYYKPYYRSWWLVMVLSTLPGSSKTWTPPQSWKTSRLRFSLDNVLVCVPPLPLGKHVLHLCCIYSSSTPVPTDTHKTPLSWFMHFCLFPFISWRPYGFVFLHIPALWILFSTVSFALFHVRHVGNVPHAYFITHVTAIMVWRGSFFVIFWLVCCNRWCENNL